MRIQVSFLAMALGLGIFAAGPVLTKNAWLSAAPALADDDGGGDGGNGGGDGGNSGGGSAGGSDDGAGHDATDDHDQPGTDDAADTPDVPGSDDSADVPASTAAKTANAAAHRKSKKK